MLVGLKFPCIIEALLTLLSPASLPSGGRYEFDDGNTVFLGCDVLPFSLTAYFGDDASLAPFSDQLSTSSRVDISIGGGPATATATRRGSAVSLVSNTGAPASRGPSFSRSSTAVPTDGVGTRPSLQVQGQGQIGSNSDAGSSQAPSPTAKSGSSPTVAGGQSSSSAPNKGNSGSKQVAGNLLGLLSGFVVLIL